MPKKDPKTSQALRRLALGVALLGLAGCYPPSALEMDYGNAVRNNVAQQVVNPRAGFNPKPAVGLSPQAAANDNSEQQSPQSATGSAGKDIEFTDKSGCRRDAGK